MSPTQRTLAWLRNGGWTCAIVEKWNAHVRRRIDVWGFGDILAIRDGMTALIQCTSTPHVAERIDKIRSIPESDKWLRGDRQIYVIGWSRRGARGKRKLWRARLVRLTLDAQLEYLPDENVPAPWEQAASIPAESEALPLMVGGGG